MEFLVPLLAIGYLTAGVWLSWLERVAERGRGAPARAPTVPPLVEPPAPAAAADAPVPARQPPSVMPIKGGWQYLIGRRIDAVVVNSFPVGITRLVQVHLVLDGGCNFEIYSPTGGLAGVKGLYRGDLDEVLNFKCLSPDARVYGDRRLVPRDEDGPRILWP